MHTCDHDAVNEVGDDFTPLRHAARYYSTCRGSEYKLEEPHDPLLGREGTEPAGPADEEVTFSEGDRVANTPIYETPDDCKKIANKLYF